MPSPRILASSFYERPALIVAKELVGKYLVRQLDDELIVSQINETEAYIGPHDLACHASRGRTLRTEVMFGPPGVWYVYFIYGVHWMLNVVTEPEGYPAAVLIRGAGPWNGPGKLTKALQIDKSLNGQEAAKLSGLWIEDRGDKMARGKVKRTPRIGIDYAGPWAEKPYRFLLVP